MCVCVCFFFIVLLRGGCIGGGRDTGCGARGLHRLWVSIRGFHCLMPLKYATINCKKNKLVSLLTARDICFVDGFWVPGLTLLFIVLWGACKGKGETGFQESVQGPKDGSGIVKAGSKVVSNPIPFCSVLVSHRWFPNPSLAVLL